MTKKLNTLLVDDSKVIVSALEDLLSEHKNIQKLEVADTLARARDIIEETAIDVIILDLQLPDGSGMDLLRWIKKDRPEIIVIMFTTFSETFFRSITKRLGADYFFDKSSEFEEIPKVFSKIDQMHNCTTCS